MSSKQIRSALSSARTATRPRATEPVTDVQRSPPHSVAAEQSVLGSILVSKGACLAHVRSRVTLDQFYLPTHQTIYSLMCDMGDASRPIDLITLTQILRDRELLLSVGDASYVTELQLFVPDDSLVDYYIDIIKEKHVLRSVIAAGTEIVRRAFEEQIDVADIVADLTTKTEAIRSLSQPSLEGVENFALGDLLTFDARKDPTVLIGNRWLCRGFTALWAGAAGIGKSTLEMQLAIYWACGLACFGITPVRPLKSLIVQAENDLGDTGEQLQGVIDGIMRSTQDIELESVARRSMIERNVAIKRVIGVTGERFIALLEALCEQERSDCVWVDPLFAFAGCDLLNAKEIGFFLREGLIPLAVRQQACVHVVHHVGKPARDGDSKASWSDLDFQYLGFGSSEIQNAFRAVNVLLPLAKIESDNGASPQEQSFRLILSKRGSRAQALDVSGNTTNNLYLAHSHTGLCWLQVDKPPEQKKQPRKKSGEFDRKFSVETLIKQIKEAPNLMKTSALMKYVCIETGMSRATFYRLFDEAKNSKLIALKTNEWTVANPF
jgi:hypothetical protein